jgi:hypothetical protein
MFGRNRHPARLTPAELDRIAATTAVEQEDTADYHNGTPDGQAPWWERTHNDDDSDGMT